jgi:hypothetical protein
MHSNHTSGTKDESGWDGVEDTDPAIQRGAYLMFEERCSGRIDPRNDEPIDFIPVEARCSEIDPAGAVT